MKRKPRLLYGLCIVALASQTALGWWLEGHDCIARAAVSVLPADMPEFFRQGAGTIASYSSEPDLWTGRNVPELRKSERFNHYLDLELLEGRPLPATRGDFEALCRELKLEPAAVGTLPYAIQEWEQRLALAFAQHRDAPDDKAIRAKILYIAGVLSHYTADASQPLHCTVHYDGKAQPGKPSPRTGIHLRMDALPGQLGVEAEDVADGVEIQASGDVFATTIEAILESNGRVGRVYALEDKLPPAEEPIEHEPDADVRALALECCQAGVRLTATVWYSAWVQSESIELPPWQRRAAAQATQ